VVRDKYIRAYFGDEQQSALGGAPLLGEVELTEGLVGGAANVLRDWRYPNQITFSLAHLLLQRAILICCGFEDGIDSKYLANDPGIKVALGIGLDNDSDSARLASQTTISRFENEMGPFNLYRLATFLVFRYIALKKKPPKNIRLYFDGSCVPTRGQQQYSSYRKYYNTRMYFPLFVFDQDGFLLTAILRPGEHWEARLTIPVLKRLVRAFRNAWSKVEITVVMDAAFNDPKIYDWCEDKGVYYLIKLKNAGGKGGGLYANSHQFARPGKISFSKRYGKAKYLDSDVTKSSIETEIRRLPKVERKKELKELKRRVVRKYGEFDYRTGQGGKDPKQWRDYRRVLTVCVYDDWGDHRSFYVTNIVGLRSEYLIENLYSQRGKAEQFIKDSKAFRCDKLSCEEFFANQCRLLLHVLAYQLLYQLRSSLPKRYQSMSLKSIRDYYMRIPVTVKNKCRSLDLIWSSSFPWKNSLHALCSRLSAKSLDRTDWFELWFRFLKPLIIPKESSPQVA